MRQRETKPFPYFVGIHSLEELVTKQSRVCVINILGSESRSVTPISHEYSGGNVVAGVQYGRRGELETRSGTIPVYRSVRDVMEHYRLAGMKILLFAFNGDLHSHPYLPHNYTENCVAYTGTHDNNTVRGWFNCEMTAHEEHNVRQYLNRDVNADSISWDLMKLAWQSKSRLSVAPMQDLLSLDGSARMNTPGVGEGCWTWRCPYLSVNEELAARLMQLTTDVNRVATTRLVPPQ